MSTGSYYDVYAEARSTGYETAGFDAHDAGVEVTDPRTVENYSLYGEVPDAVQARADFYEAVNSNPFFQFLFSNPLTGPIMGTTVGYFSVGEIGGRYAEAGRALRTGDWSGIPLFSAVNHLSQIGKAIVVVAIVGVGSFICYKVYRFVRK